MPIPLFKYLSTAERLTQRIGCHLSGHLECSNTTWNVLPPPSLAGGHHSPSSYDTGKVMAVDRLSIHKDQMGQGMPISGIQQVLNNYSRSDEPRTMTWRIAFAEVGGDILLVKDWLHKNQKWLKSCKGAKKKSCFRITIPSLLAPFPAFWPFRNKCSFPNEVLDQQHGLGEPWNQCSRIGSSWPKQSAWD